MKRRSDKTVALELMGGDFAVINMRIFNDSNISLDAKGLLCMIIFLLNNKMIDKNLCVAEIAEYSADSEDATQKAFDELSENGYLVTA